MDLTIIIPTRNRAQLAARAVRAHLSQLWDGPPFEIIVVDDGSTDNTRHLLGQLASENPGRLRTLAQPNRGAAAARNAGLRAARGRIVLYTDDDIVPAPNFATEHYRAHATNGATSLAVIGRTVWPPEPKPRPFKRWYGEAGPLLDLRALETGATTWRHFYSGNLSLNREFQLRNGLYDERFRGYGWEDMELGYRLWSHGLRITYNPRAVGHHFQEITFMTACERAKAAAASRRIFDETAAGRRLAAEEATRDRKLRRRLARLAAQILVPPLAPIRYAIDSPIRLPDPLYRAFFWYYGARAAATQPQPTRQND